MKEKKKRKSITKSLWAYALAFMMLLSTFTGFMDVEVRAADPELRAPTIKPVSPGDTVISGSGAGQLNIDGQRVYATVHVILKGEDGTEKATGSFTRKRSASWKVTLSVPAAAGDTVIAYNQVNDVKSAETTVKVELLLADKYNGKLIMPTLEVWSEDTNVLEADAVEDIVSAFKEANNALTPIGDKNFEANLNQTNGIAVAGDGKSLTVTFSDGSKIENFNISDKVTVKEITEVSTAPTINTLKVVDSKITGKVDLTNVEAPARLKVEIVTSFGENELDNFCTENGCSITKGSKVLATVDLSTGEFSYDIGNNNVVFGKDFGVIVKEYKKKNNCGTIQPELVIPKVDVRDPKNLTDEEKKKVEEKIREANTVRGTSKLPDGTGEYGGVPAIIEFDKDGNVKIIAPNDLEREKWENGKPVFKKTQDGSYVFQNGKKEAKTAEPKDILNNLPPKPPTVKISDDNKNITVTPDAADTDVKEVSVTYETPDGTKKTLTATKDDEGNWSVPANADGTVNQNGVITLPANKVKGGTDVKAIVKDDGFQEAQQDAKESGNKTLNIPEVKTKAKQVEELGGLDPMNLKKWVGDELNWKDGLKVKDSVTAENKTKIDALLAETGTSITDENSRGTTTQGNYKGKIKVTFDDGSFLEVEQTLYVSNHVVNKNTQNLPDDALKVEFKLGEGTKVENPGSAAVEGPKSYETYKVKPGTDLKTYKLPIPGISQSIVESINLSAQEGYVDPVWNTDNFVASNTNKVFTATATKAYTVTVQPNGGTGDEKIEYVKPGDKYTLPAKDTFTAPNENQEFSGWQVGNDTTLKQAGENVDISGDTTVKAIWKPIEFKVSFQAGTGATGTMDEKTVNKGSQYELPTPTFNAPNNQEFAGWQVPGESEVKQAGDKINITGNVTLTATWKPIMLEITFDKGEGSGTKDKVSVAKGSEYTLPNSDGFTAPANKEFAGWKVEGQDGVKKPGEKITVDANTKLTAVYKPIPPIDAPKVTVDTKTGNLMISPPTPPEGQEIKSVTVTYKDANGVEKTVIIEKSADKWSFVPASHTNEEIANETNGVITVPKGKYKPGEAVKAYANNQADRKSSETDATPIEISFNVNGASKDVESAITIKGENYVLPAIYDLPEYKLTMPPGKEFDGWEVNGKKLKAGDTINVNKNTVVKAIWKDKPVKNGGYFYEPSKDIQNYKPNKNVKPVEKVKPVEDHKVTNEFETGRHFRYIYGYVDNTVRPEGMITRSEAAALIARLANLDMTDNSKPNFNDTPSAWYNTAINAVVKLNLMFVDKYGNFRPNEAITRAEFARALLYIDKKNDAVAPFADVKGHEFEAAINQAYGNGLIVGYLDGTFKPDAFIQRAEAAKILNKYANRGVTLEGMSAVKMDLKHFIDINESHWAYCEIMEAANSHEYRRVKGTLEETWTKILADDIMK